MIGDVPVKITLLHYASPPIVGGVETIIEHHARLMTEHGHHVQIVAGRGAPFEAQIPFVHLPFVDSRHEHILALKKDLDQGIVPEAFHGMVESIEAELTALLANCDILIAHNVCSLNKNLPLTAALFNISQKSAKPHIILWHHDLAWTTPRYAKELYDRYPWDLLKQHWKGVTQVTISTMRQNELAALMNIRVDEITVIPSGVNVEAFHKFEQQTRDFAKRLGLFHASPLLLLPVRITPRKNIELALRVLACLREEFPHAALVVTGPLGPHNPANVEYFERLRVLRSELGLQEVAHFLADHTEEYIPDTVISDLYRMADALLLPSAEEGFGIPILEAGISGIPVFCSDIPPLRELAGDDANYFSLGYEPESIAAMMHDHLMKDKAYRLRSRVRSQYSWQGVYENRIEPLLKKQEEVGR
jgi:glycosyltransferase involved in cell wall biosynthesis